MTEFSLAHPYLFTLLCLFAIAWIGALCMAPLRLAKRWIRHLDIKQHGWPPPDIDADGDFEERDDD